MNYSTQSFAPSVASSVGPAAASTPASANFALFDIRKIRSRFPIFEQTTDTVFLDNASTTHKPDSVIQVFDTFYRQDCSNAGRAMYPSSLRAAQKIEKARHDVARLIGAQAGEVAFTSGATDSFNTIAWSWGLSNLKDGDEILFCPQDHSSAILPWQNLQAVLAGTGRNISLVPFGIHAVGDYDFRSIKQALSSRTRVIALSHIHHVFGVDMEIADIRKIVGPDVVISLDASQSIGHIKVDVKELDVDFVSFSGHKMFAGNGVGVLFARTIRHEEMIPFRCGGQSSPVGAEVNEKTRAAFISKVESGTANIPAVVSMSEAIRFIEEVGLVNIESHVSALTGQLVSALSGLPGIIFSPGPVTCGCPGGFGILSFRFEQAQSLDIASALADEQIQVRSGLHCVATADNSEDFIRVSMHVYNDVRDIQILSDSLRSMIS
jgi:cysteine desulfurase/selenocysteine lyase